jgi:hypothetical protein
MTKRKKVFCADCLWCERIEHRRLVCTHVWRHDFVAGKKYYPDCWVQNLYGNCNLFTWPFWRPILVALGKHYGMYEEEETPTVIESDEDDA